MAEKKNTSIFWKNLGNAIKDWYEVISAIWWALMTAIQHSTQWLSWGIIKSEYFTLFFLLLFLVSTCYAIIKAKLNQRKAEKELRKFKKEFETIKDNQALIKSEAQTGGRAYLAARDITIYDNNGSRKEIIAEPLSITVEGTPSVKEGYLGNSAYIVPFGGGEARPYFIPPTKVLFAQVDFSNNPKIRIPENTVKSVRAIITYMEKDEILGSTTGCWASITDEGDSEMVDLLFNGRPRILYLAMRYALDDGEENYPLWMYGRETTHSYFLDKHSNFTYRLCDGLIQKRFVIKVNLIGTSLEQEYVFPLDYEGKGGAMKLSQIISLHTTLSSKLGT